MYRGRGDRAATGLKITQARFYAISEPCPIVLFGDFPAVRVIPTQKPLFSDHGPNGHLYAQPRDLYNSPKYTILQAISKGCKPYNSLDLIGL